MQRFDGKPTIALELELIGVQPFSEFKHRLIVDWLTHPGKVQIQPLGIRLVTTEHIDCIFELSVQIIKRCITTHGDLGYVAEPALLTASVLSTQRDDPFFRQRHTNCVWNTIDLISETKKISFHVDGFTVIRNG